jgi:hypothetical protein
MASPSFKLRLPEELRELIDERAIETDQSVNSVIVRALREQFGQRRERDELDELLIEPALRQMAWLMLTTFERGGRIAAESKTTEDQPQMTTAEWLRDTDCYRAAAWSVVAALLGVFPRELAQLERKK